MKFPIRTRILGCVCAVGLSAALAATSRLGAQDSPSPQPSHYGVVDLGTLGGTVSSGNTINNRGWVMGSSNEATGVQLATVWLYGQQIPLGTLGGPDSNVFWPVKNNFGLISGISENGAPDPLNETFSCPVFNFTSGNSCVAFAWQFGKMTQLPGLGGNNSVGGGNNDLGQIVGWAENTVHDPTCTSGGGLVQVLQFEAVIWQRTYNGAWQVRQLPPLGSDPDSAATAINDLGRAVGISGQCGVAIGGVSAIHAVLWQDGKPIDLGNLGSAHGWNTPFAINKYGVIVGFANQTDDIVNGSLILNPEAFDWTKESGMKPLGTLPGDAISEATDINAQGQIVGISARDANFDDQRAFIYQNGHMTPLNNLIGSAGNELFIFNTGGINDRGEIAAQANLVSNGVVTTAAHAVLLIPTTNQAGDAQASADERQLIIPEDVQEQMRHRAGFGRPLSSIRPN